MRHTALVWPAAVAAQLIAASGAIAAAALGQSAPPFSATDTSGRTVSLAEFKGRTVVLEWVNPECRFVQKHYGSGNMQATQKSAVDRGVVWLAIDSTRPDHVDYKPPATLAAWMAQRKAAPTDTLMDGAGAIGRAYGARTTPHMFVIDPQGRLVYAGAIDSSPTANPADIASATNYVSAALAETLAGKPVSVPATQPYGCSVKY
jgi:hypothetical protein